jgi:hypothetical protein
MQVVEGGLSCSSGIAVPKLGKPHSLFHSDSNHACVSTGCYSHFLKTAAFQVVRVEVLQMSCLRSTCKYSLTAEQHLCDVVIGPIKLQVGTLERLRNGLKMKFRSNITLTNVPPLKYFQNHQA